MCWRRCFSQLTGIRVVHEITGEDDVVNKLRTQSELGLTLYDGYISDSDLIGQHFREGKVLVLSDFMAGEGQAVTLPTLDLNDFIGLQFHHRSGWQAVPASRPAVCQPLLVPA